MKNIDNNSSLQKRKKICLIGPATNPHIKKWASWFSTHNYEVHIISFLEANIDGTTVHKINLKIGPDASDLSKIRYLFTGKQIRNLIRKINPDIISVHYASSYGIAVALSGIRNYNLSVWGSDIYEFPNKSIIHRLILKYSLYKASRILSTSKSMAGETKKYTKKNTYITPFGVDIDLFNPSKRVRSYLDDGKIIIGNIKTLSETYGISNIIKAAAYIRNIIKMPIEVRIAGKGNKLEEYKRLCKELGVDDVVRWLGFISQESAANEWANMDIAIIPSNSESFGVSAVEAQASGTPVIITDLPGLLEATNPNVSSLVVSNNNPKQIGDAIRFLLQNTGRIKEMGDAGRKFVCENYEIDKCFYRIESTLEKFGKAKE